MTYANLPLVKIYETKLQFLWKCAFDTQCQQLSQTFRSIKHNTQLPLHIKLLQVQGIRQTLKQAVQMAKVLKKHSHFFKCKRNNILDNQDYLFQLCRKYSKKLTYQFKSLLSHLIKKGDFQTVVSGDKQAFKAKEIIANSLSLKYKLRCLSEIMSTIRQIKNLQLSQLNQKIKSASIQALKINNRRSSLRVPKTIKTIKQICQQHEDKQNHNGYLLNQ